MINQPTSSNLGEATATPPPVPQNAQPPAENPLDKLRDIHLPEPIDVFPYAPGWWILLAILLIIAGYFIYRKVKYRQAIRLLAPAKAELNQLKLLSGDSINGQAIASLSALIKRVCLLYFPRSKVASLSGVQWLLFLNKQVANILDKSSSSEPLFDDKTIELFSQAAYQKSAQIKQDQWLNLITASETCLEAIITEAARQQLSGKPNQQADDNLVRANQ